MMNTAPAPLLPRARRLADVDSNFDRFRRTRDPRALDSVVREVGPPLYSAACALTRDPATAEDLVQTTFVAAMDRAGAYDPSYPVMPWLIGILQNRARRMHRAEARRPDPERLQRSATAPAPEAVAVETELFFELRHALRRIPATYREVLRLHLESGMSPVDIAVTLRRSRSTVRTQIMRGLERLRMVMRKPEGWRGRAPRASQSSPEPV